MASKWALFRNRNFFVYYSGFVLSMLGDAVFTLAVSWMIVKSTGSGILMGTYLMTMGIPRTLLMILGGVIVDRSNPRLIMIWSDCLRAIVLFFLVLIGHNGLPPIWSLFVLAAIFGTADALYWPAAGAFRQRMVSDDHYTQSNALFLGASQMNSILGPMLGAGLLALGSYEISMLLDSLSFVISAGTLLFVKLESADDAGSTAKANVKAKSATKRSFKADLLEGLSFVWKTPIIMTMIIVSFLANLGANGISVGLPFFANQLGAGSFGFSQMTAGWGIGGFVGALLFAVFPIRRLTPKMAMVSFLLQGCSLYLLRFSGNHWEAVGFLVFAGLCSAALQIVLPSVYQSIIPKTLMGRVNSVTMVVSMGSTPLAQAGAGWLIDGAGVYSLFNFGGMIEVGSAALSFLLPAIRLYGTQAKQTAVENQTSV